MEKKKEIDRDVFGTPKNRSKTWDIKKSRDTKKDRRKSKTRMQDIDWKEHFKNNEIDVQNPVYKKEEENK